MSLITSILITTKKTKNKNLSYKNLVYKQEFAIWGTYLDETKKKIVKNSKTSYKILLITKQIIPYNTLFQDDLFKKTCLEL